MKIIKIGMRIWLAITSVALFAASWIALAHAPKPVQFTAADLPAMPALPPVPSLQQAMNSREFREGLTITQRPVARLRTRGS
jgi:hypothetical protein